MLVVQEDSLENVIFERLVLVELVLERRAVKAHLELSRILLGLLDEVHAGSQQ